uniref:Lactate/malate dehydrogenase N-terminal domain-containing protein n=1 Tax=Lotharella globosa TaxID=91324 RepID=A0A6V3IZ98_9EUKA
MSSAAIIGAGSVGSTIASFLIWGGAYEEIIMIDINKERCEGEVMDLQDAGFLTDTQVRMGEYKDASSASIVIITAGAKQRKGETREALLQRNVRILSSIAKSILPVKDDTLVLLVANPVDILTQLFQEISGIPRERVFGSGTFLDTMRLRTELSMRYNIAATHIHTYIVGMHGDLQVRLGPFDACDPFCDYNDPQRALDAHQQTRNTHTHTLRHALTFASTNWIHTCNHYKTDSAVGCWQCR